MAGVLASDATEAGGSFGSRFDDRSARCGVRHDGMLGLLDVT